MIFSVPTLTTEIIPKASAKIMAAMPCFNTQQFVADIVSRSRRFVDEVVVIDDGSSDATGEIARKAGATVIRHGVNRGYGEAIRSCFRAAQVRSVDILVILDGDGQHDPDEIPHLINPILREEAELVIGSRFLNGWNRVPRYRRIGIDLITFLWNIGSTVKVSDSQSGFRAYGKKMIQDLSFSSKGMSASIEILEKIRKKKPNIKEIPISCSYENNNSTLTVKALWHGIKVAIAVIWIRLENRL